MHSLAQSKFFYNLNILQKVIDYETAATHICVLYVIQDILKHYTMFL